MRCAWIVVVGLVGVMLAAANPLERVGGSCGSDETHVFDDGEADFARAPRFEAVDIYVDSGPIPMAAYQVEIIARFAGDGSATLVGVEGGAHAEYAAPPYYDPRALHDGQVKERIIIAALSTASARDLPTGRVRVARLHVRVDGDVRYVTNLMTAGSANAEKMTAIAQAVVVTGEQP